MNITQTPRSSETPARALHWPRQPARRGRAARRRKLLSREEYVNVRGEPPDQAAHPGSELLRAVHGAARHDHREQRPALDPAPPRRQRLRSAVVVDAYALVF